MHEHMAAQITGVRTWAANRVFPSLACEAVDDVASDIRATTGGLLTRSGVAQGPAPSVPQFAPGQPSQYVNIWCWPLCDSRPRQQISSAGSDV